MERKVITVLDNQIIISQLLQPAGKVFGINPHCFNGRRVQSFLYMPPGWQYDCE